MNQEQSLVFEKSKQGNNILLTGGAGVGKSFVTTGIIDYLRSIGKKIGICAMTGSAAILINGTTLHSFMGFGLGKGDVWGLVNKIQKNKVITNKLKTLDVLVIDEVSMLNDSLFEKISEIFQVLRRSEKPFGGVQIILVGDPFQLCPIDGEYCFLSKKWKESNFEVVLLKQNMRVTNDLIFKNILDRLRWGNCSDEDYSILKKLKNTKFPNNIVPTRLYSRNADVDRINNLELQKLIDLGNRITDYPIIYPEHSIKRKETIKYIKNIKLSDSVGLCIGAQVVITRNIDIPGGLINGTRGKIVNIHSEGVVLMLLNGSTTEIEYYTFKPEDEPMVEINYIPLKLAWAISIHSSQGMTLDALEIDLGDSIFACGQAYTGLSRVRSLKNVRIVQVNKKSFKTNSKVIEFYNEFGGV